MLRVPLLHLHRGVDDAEDEDGSTDVERPDDGVGYYTIFCYILDTQKGEEKREYKTYHRTGIAEETLYGVSLCLLLLVYHVAHQHLEWLHSHVDAGVEKHEGYQAEEHCAAYGQAERTGVGQQAHNQDGCCSTDEEIRDATAEATPRLVAQCADDGLYDDSHKGRKHPKIAQAMRVCP